MSSQTRQNMLNVAANIIDVSNKADSDSDSDDDVDSDDAEDDESIQLSTATLVISLVGEVRASFRSAVEVLSM